MNENKKKSQRKMDNPEQFATENEDMHDKFMSEQTVDPIPMEDLREEKLEEKRIMTKKRLLQAKKVQTVNLVSKAPAGWPIKTESESPGASSMFFAKIRVGTVA